ncbi:septation ring formation regulator EzrA [Bacillaceae bacterium Marseille-Q3522]|nr:septation ring formation regulator EzrA [Bacillaceae bacterium Marseille-Q3522]
MRYVIVGIALITCLFFAGFLVKKRYFKEIDRLELWKIDLMNRPVLEELAKVKRLNMSGETEHLFDTWRKDWDEIITVHLPDVEEMLFDAEECIDKYSFKKAKNIQAKTDAKLLETEAKIDKLLYELHDLVDSEKKSKMEIETLNKQFQEMKKQLLAHHHTYGKAVSVLESQINELGAQLALFEEKTAQGNYLEARGLVQELKAAVDVLSLRMERIPGYLIEFQVDIPEQLQALKNGYKEMENQGYVLDHIPFQKEIAQIEENVKKCLELLENAAMEEIEQLITVIKAEVELLFERLENEVNAKQFLYDAEEPVRELLLQVKTAGDELKNEFNIVQRSYHISESDKQKQEELQKGLALLLKRFEQLDSRLKEKKAVYSQLSDELQSVKTLLEKTEQEQKAFAEMLQALRKDELEARKVVEELRRKMAETIRHVSKSNLPGLPEDYHYFVDEAEEAIAQVIHLLQESPLNVTNVRRQLEQAVESVEKLTETTNELVETMWLAEKVIQYGNRYRSSNPEIAHALNEAEHAFRTYQYKLALEQAATSLENIEPGVLKKIEKLLENNEG